MSAGGRPTSQTPDLVEAFLDSLATGVSVAETCRRADMPDETTIYRWLRKDAEFRGEYMAAKSAGLERIANEIVDIADGVKEGKQAINKARLRINARQWTLVKLLPHVYGDKIDLQHSGNVNVTVKSFTRRAGACLVCASESGQAHKPGCTLGAG